MTTKGQVLNTIKSSDAYKKFITQQLNPKIQREKEAWNLIKENRGNFTKKTLRLIFDIVDPNKMWFKNLLAKPNMNLFFKAPINEINDWFDEILNPRNNYKKKIDHCMNEKKIKGASKGLITFILYLSNPKRFNLWIDQTAKGLIILNRISKLKNRDWGNSYAIFNSEAIKFRDEKKLKSQEIDWILTRIANNCKMENNGTKDKNYVNKQNKSLTIEQNYFKVIATDVLTSLRNSTIITNLRLRTSEKLNLENSYTDGWKIILGKELSRNLYIELWFDKWTGYKSRKLWFGIYSQEPTIINSISKSCIQTIGSPKIITEFDLLPNFQRLKNKLCIEDFGKPLWEKYINNGIYFYGIYQEANNISIQSIIDFYETLFSEIKKDNTINDVSDIFPREENRLLVRNHIVRERSRYLSALRKKKDDYRCHICNFKFTEKFGKIGERFAEVHHIVPLSQLNSKVGTKLDDLITVCSNCHRMLHRLEGNKLDIPKLKKIINSYTL